MKESRQRILSAARALYQERGADGVSMRKVADAVGLTAPAIYRHYKGKDALLDAIAEVGFAVFETYLGRMFAARNPIRRLEAAAEAYLDFALDQPQLYELVFLTSRRNLRRFPRDFAAGRSRTGEMLRRQVEECMQTGAFAADDPLETALSLWAHAHGLVVMYRTGRFGPHADRFRPLYRRSIRRLLKGLQA
jgi:AcrR family transcriptional regulator